MKERVRWIKRKSKISKQTWKQKNEWEIVESFTGVRNLIWWHKIKIIDFVWWKATKEACWKCSLRKLFLIRCVHLPSKLLTFSRFILFSSFYVYEKYKNFQVSKSIFMISPSTPQVPRCLNYLSSCVLLVPKRLEDRMLWVSGCHEYLQGAQIGQYFAYFCPNK